MIVSFISADIYLSTSGSLQKTFPPSHQSVEFFTFSIIPQFMFFFAQERCLTKDRELKSPVNGRQVMYVVPLHNIEYIRDRVVTLGEPDSLLTDSVVILIYRRRCAANTPHKGDHNIVYRLS